MDGGARRFCVGRALYVGVLAVTWAGPVACSTVSSPSASQSPIVGEWSSPVPAANYFFNENGSAGTFMSGGGGGCDPWFVYTLTDGVVTLTATQDVGPRGGSAMIAFSDGNNAMTFEYTMSEGLPATPLYVPNACDVDSGVCRLTFTRVSASARSECPSN